ncbi:MAG: helix-turn-helix domain-containing protein [Acidimicrobiia bacterium]|nr:helix-turn-helix domain-containing protein [Acidimicrobiia bacterium]
MSGEFSESIQELTTAFGDPTRREIYVYLRRSLEGATAAEIGGEFDIHANVARHHLEKLREAGYVEVAEGRPGGATGHAAGRPSKRYAATAKRVSLDGGDDGFLVDLLLGTLTTLEPDEASVLAERAGREYGTRLAGSHRNGRGALSRAEVLRAVASALSSRGFAADVRAASDEIVAHMCPFGDAAERFPHIVCALDKGMVQGLCDALSDAHTEVHLRASRPQGDAECVTTL